MDQSNRDNPRPQKAQYRKATPGGQEEYDWRPDTLQVQIRLS